MNLASSLFRILCLCATVHSTAFSQAVLRSVDFENYPTGPGELEGPYSGVSFFNVTGNAFTDSFQGIADTSPIGTGKAGRIGGPSQATGGPFFNFIYFPGNFSDPFYIASGTSRSLVLKQFDFSLQRGSITNPASYYFYSVNSSSAAGANFSTHAIVAILPDNSIYVGNNTNQSLNDTGFNIFLGTPYTLLVGLDYDQLLWSAALLNKNTEELFILVDDNPIETNGFSFGPYTKTEEINIEISASAYNPTNSQILDILYIDNFASTAIPEPSAFAAFLGLASLGFVASRRRRN